MKYDIKSAFGIKICFIPEDRLFVINLLSGIIVFLHPVLGYTKNV